MAAVQPGQRVYMQGGCAVPAALVDALMARRDELRDVEIVHLHTEGPAPYTRPEMEGHFRHNALFIGANVREAVRNGRADVTPVMLSDAPSLFETTLPLDVALIQVSPPDHAGYCSLGISVDCARPASLAAQTVIAQVNPRMPRTHGDSFLHVSQIDYLVEAEAELVEVECPAPDEVALRIGQNVVSLIEDEATIQTGIGTIPNAVLASLTGPPAAGCAHGDVLRRPARPDRARRRRLLGQKLPPGQDRRLLRHRLAAAV
jgi:acyl-CoA hydrolase